MQKFVSFEKYNQGNMGSLLLFSKFNPYWITHPVKVWDEIIYLFPNFNGAMNK